MCRIYCFGFFGVARWTPPLAGGKRFSFYWGWEWSWWPRPGYHQFRPWKRLALAPIPGLTIKGDPVYEMDE